MPRIDNLEIKNKIFKKKEYRSWDGNLLEKLKLPSEKNTSNLIQEKIEPKKNIKFNKSSIEVHKEFKNSSNYSGHNLTNRVQVEPEIQLETALVLIRKLSGNEKKLFFLIINLCLIKGELSTGDLLGEELNHALSTTRNGRETAIKRLVKK